jgi:hypothetical protein
MGEDTEAQNFTNKTLRDIILNFIIAGMHSPSIYAQLRNTY